MPGYTPNLNLPYPLSTDPISDGDDVIQDLAETIEGLWAGPFVAVTLLNGWVTAAGPGDIPGYRLFGDNVQLKGAVSLAAGLIPGTNDTVFQLPVGFRPAVSRTLITAGSQSLSIGWAMVRVNASGNFSVDNTIGTAATGPLVVYLNNIICPLAA